MELPLSVTVDLRVRRYLFLIPPLFAFKVFPSTAIMNWFTKAFYNGKHFLSGLLLYNDTFFIKIEVCVMCLEYNKMYCWVECPFTGTSTFVGQYHYEDITTVKTFNSCTSRPNVCQCLVVQIHIDNKSKNKPS